ncbi:hypothetical protein Tco_0534631 [Tanacetum coccineum]
MKRAYLGLRNRTALSKDRSRTLMEVARTMLIFAKAIQFYGVEAIATCVVYTQSILLHTLTGRLLDASDSVIETLFDHVAVKVYDTNNAPETDSEARFFSSIDIIFASTNPNMAIYLPFEMTQPFKIVDDGKMSFFLGLPRFLKIPEASLSTSKFVRKSEKGLVLTTMPPLTLSMAKRPLDEDKGGKLIDLYTISCWIFRYLKRNHSHGSVGSAQFLGHQLVSGNQRSRKVCISTHRSEYIAYQDAVLKSSRSLLNCETRALPRERFATLLPLLGVKQMSPETLKELQDESVSE